MARTDYGAILSTVIKDTSDAVREVNGTSNLIAPNQWGTAIRTMHSDSDYENALEQMIEETATGDIASFSDGANAIPCPSVLCTINPVQAGSGDPSPSNVRPITGHTELNLVHTGKNLFDKTAVSNNKWLSTTTGLEENASGYCVSDYIPVKNGQTVFIPTSGTARRWFYDSNKNPITYLNNSGNQAYTPVADGYIRVSIQVTGATPVSLDTYQIEVGSSATTYEPYTGSTTTTDLGTTVYGGTLDVVSGVLTLDRGMVKISDINWTGSTSNPPIFRGVLSSIPNIQIPPNNAVPTTAITESFGAYAYTPLSASSIGKFAISDAGSNRIVFIDNSVNILEAFLQAYGDDILVYPLATPTTTQLTPQEVKSLLGSNNFYHDCNGQVAVTYRANGQLYVEQHS